jgi:hypothetical protein
MIEEIRAGLLTGSESVVAGTSSRYTGCAVPAGESRVADSDRFTGGTAWG